MRRPSARLSGWRLWAPLLAMLVFVAGYSAGILALALRSNVAMISTLGGLAVLVLGAPIVIGVGMKRRTLARARGFWYRICPGCGHDLRACDEAGPCPGCSRPYTPETLVKHWEGTDSKSASAKRWRPLSARGVLSPAMLMGIGPAAVGLVMAHVLLHLGLVPRTMAPLGLVLAGPLVSIAAPWLVARDKRDFKRVEGAGFLVCPECAGALPALSDVERGEACCLGVVGGRVGRCGQRYSHAWLARTWTQSYAHVSGTRGPGHWRPDRGARRMSIVFGLTMFGVAIVLGLLSQTVSFVSLPLPLAGTGIAVIAVATMVFVVLIARHSGYHHTRMVRLRAHGYRFCPECGYDLRESAAEGVCPECGFAYTPELLRKGWEGEPRAEPPAL